MSTNTKRIISTEDLYNLRLLSNPQISPDGNYIVVAVQRVDKETEKKYSNLWLISTQDGTCRQFTTGDHSDISPQWSADSQSIAFISNRKDDKQCQLHIIRLNGGEAYPLTNMQGDFGMFQWSPNGKQFVCQFRKKDQELIDWENDERTKKLGITHRRITRLFYKADGKGYLPQERWHIWTISAETGKAKQLTDDGRYDEITPVWSPNGEEIMFVSNHAKNPDLDIDANDIFIMSIKNGKVRKLETPYHLIQIPNFSPDGKWVAYYAQEKPKSWWQNVQLWLMPSDGNGQVKNLTGHTDLHVSNWTLGDMCAPPPLSLPAWSADSRTIHFQVDHHGKTSLYSIDIDGNNLQTVSDEEGVIYQFSMAQTAPKIAYLLSSLNDPTQIWLKDLANDENRQMTTFNHDLFADVDLGTVESMWFKGPNDVDLQGWIFKPPNFDANKKYPSILEIHGGPTAQYGFAFMYEFYFLAAHGYVVFCTNPHGSQGYGNDFAGLLTNNWGGPDYDDLMTWSDYLVKQPYIDPNRMGVTGGSYGGYMTTSIIGRTDRFKAAVAQRVVSNLTSMFGSCDLNWVIGQECNNEPPWQNVENYWRMSPISHIANAKTPTLIIHSENDMRCSLEQGEQVFVALKYLGVETEMVVFSDESHDLSRTGRTDRRIARLNSIVNWFDRFLKLHNP
ncbi:MAG: hypothetical protein B6242_05645 [Anaerolineaceae bacterium 4572_78]|nr:MAG: hypothetical protein B6242_05645 [Anaerolineaceae bacterium 4572_78]